MLASDARSLAAQKGCDFSAGRQQRRKRDIEACSGSNSQKEQKPLRTADIYNALVAQGHPFTFEEPKKILGIRLYKMLGVQPLGGGLFKAK